MYSRLGIRSAVLAGCTFAVLIALAAPASAHTISGPKPSNFRSKIVSIEPARPGVSVRVVDLGSQLELTNRSDQAVTVLGYTGEPYLRVGPDGVLENLHSEATYVNRGRDGGTVPEGVDTRPTAEPEWRKISDGNSVRWHDHRIHWMGDQLPPQVRADPDRPFRVSEQEIVLVQNDERSTVTVALDWVPGPSPLVWFVVIGALFALGLVAALLPRWRIALAVLLGVLVVVDAVHSIAYVVPQPGGNFEKSLRFLGGSFVSVVIWIVSVPTIIGILRRKTEALYGVVFVGLMVALIGGATDLSALWKSQIPNVGPPELTRLEVAISLGLGAGLVVGAIIRMVRSGREPRADDTAGRWLSLLVVGLSDAELARIALDLDADEVLDVAMRELAIRLEPVLDTFATGTLEVRVSAPAELVWTLTGAGERVAVARGAATEAPAVAIDAPFPVLLQVLAGTATPQDPRVTVEGDTAFYNRVAPYLAERSLTRAADDHASSS
jgi:hypothetical protein